METSSYNELHEKQIRLQHLFYPGAYAMVAEAAAALLALVLFNSSQFSTRLLGTNQATSPLSLGYQPFRHLLNELDRLAIAQRLSLFLLWAVVGILVYVLVFRFLQIFINVKGSVAEGVALVRNDSQHGLFRWLASLHDFFIKTLVVLAGMAIVLIGALVCFGIASQELRNGFLESFPSNAEAFALSVIGALLSVRLIALGLTLSSRHFRKWYL